MLSNRVIYNILLVNYIRSSVFPLHMAKDSNIRMPSSGSGLVNYSSDYKSKITFKPGFVIVLAVMVIVIMILLHSLG